MFRLPRDRKSQFLLTAVTVGLLAFLVVSIWIARGQRQVALTAELRTAVLSNDLDAVEQLLAYGADANGLLKNGGGTTALHAACEIGDQSIIEILLDAGADPNHASDAGLTPLHAAAISGDLAVVKLLLAHGADAQSDPTGEHYTPTAAALKSRHTDIAMLLLRKHSEADAPVPLLNTYLAYAVLQDSVEPAKFLVERGAEPNSSSGIPQPVGSASVTRLGVDVMGQMKVGDSFQYPLHRAVWHQHHEMAKYLLSAGADTNFGGSLNLTPLMIAAHQNDVEVGKILLEGKADVDLAGAEGMTPLHVSTLFGRIEFAKLLVENGAQTALQNDEGETPLMCARWHRVSIAVGRGGKRQDRYHSTIPELIALGLDPNTPGVNGNTPVHNSARNEFTLKDLLENGGDVSARNDFGQTPFLLTVTPAWNGDNIDGYLRCAQLLLAHGADPDVRLPDGRTPMHLAAENQSRNFVYLLLEAGADPGVKDGNGETPLDIARRFSSEEIIDLLALGIAASGSDSN